MTTEEKKKFLFDFPRIPENEWMFRPNFDTSEDDPHPEFQGEKNSKEDTTSQ